MCIILQSPSMERLSLINQEGDGIDGRMRDTRGHKPGSPSIHDPYTLYKYDKVLQNTRLFYVRKKVLFFV